MDTVDQTDQIETLTRERNDYRNQTWTLQDEVRKLQDENVRLRAAVVAVAVGLTK